MSVVQKMIKIEVDECELENNILDNCEDHGCKPSIAESEDAVDPYEKKYYALFSRCQSIQQNNERLVNRIGQVKKILRRLLKEKRLLMRKLDQYEDEYRRIPVDLGIELEDSNPLPENTDPPQSSKTSSLPTGRKKIKQEKEKDPNAPKRPANPFFLFCQEQRTPVLERLQQESKDDVSHQDLTKTLAKNWNKLTAEDKTVYYEMYEKEKERYEHEMKVYSGKEFAAAEKT